MTLKLLKTLPLLLFIALPASAQMVEAKAVAQIANCKPTKVEPLRQRTGEQGDIVYEVTCQGAAKGAESKIKIRCRGKMCEAL